MTADRAAIATAVRLLAGGGLVAFPTETVYGLGADATNGEAVARLYAAKGRPSFNPLIAHVSDASSARALGRFDAAADRLAAAFWPGPLTIVLPKTPGCPVAGEMPGWVMEAVSAVPGVRSVDVELVWDPQWGMDMMSDEARLELGFM